MGGGGGAKDGGGLLSTVFVCLPFPVSDFELVCAEPCEDVVKSTVEVDVVNVEVEVEVEVEVVKL